MSFGKFFGRRSGGSPNASERELDAAADVNTEAAGSHTSFLAEPSAPLEEPEADPASMPEQSEPSESDIEDQQEHLVLACRTQRTDVIAHPSESTNVLEGCTRRTMREMPAPTIIFLLSSFFLFPICWNYQPICSTCTFREPTLLDYEPTLLD